MKLRVGTRDSKLAMIQTQLVIDAILAWDSSIEIEIVAMKTTGDKILDVSLDKIGGKGLFVKELDDALLNHQVDITIHSYKDMPMQVHPDLPIVALSQREDPRDVLLLRSGCSARDVARIGSSSQRRAAQLGQLPAWCAAEIVPMRGNLVTRLQKLERGDCDAIVLAAAGVIRSGYQDKIAHYFTTQEIIPAACQGIIAVQARHGEDVSYLQGFDCLSSHIIAAAERGFVTRLGGGCSLPVAAYATLAQGAVSLCGMYQTSGGKRAMRQGCAAAAVQAANDLGISLAEEILAELEMLR
ncbi:MAG: hydroxymethylbilane synthase [Faecalibacterium sp.]